jgi:hypothetical protein
MRIMREKITGQENTLILIVDNSEDERFERKLVTA